MKTTSEPGITVEDLTVERGGHVALTGITFDVGPGTLMGILGPERRGQKHVVRRHCGSAAHRARHAEPARR